MKTIFLFMMMWAAVAANAQTNTYYIVGLEHG